MKVRKNYTVIFIPPLSNQHLYKCSTFVMKENENWLKMHLFVQGTTLMPP